MSSRNPTSRHLSRPRGTPPRPSPAAPPAAGGRVAGLRESLPFFLVGGAALAAALTLIALQSPSAVGRLPVWTFLVAIGSISLVGGTVATLIGEPMTGLPGENELVGPDLIVVSRPRWEELNRMEEWVGGRLGPTPASPAGTPTPAPAKSPAPAATYAEVPPVPTLDELLADLPDFPESKSSGADEWTETEDSREITPPARLPIRPPPAAPKPAIAAPAPPTPVAPSPRSAPAVKPAARPARKPPARPGARAEVAAPPPAADPELERLLADLENEATKAIEARDDVPALIEPGVLTCAHCQRGIGITEKWESCEECLATYCENCAAQLAMVDGRRLCPACRHLGRGVRR